MSVQVITVENQSSKTSNREFYRAAFAVNYQLLTHFRNSPWGIRARLQLLRPGEKPPRGAYHLIVLNTSPEAGTLGFHEDEAGNNIPYSDVFAVTTKENGATLSGVMSHEVLEMLVDPIVEPPRTVTHNGKIYIVEICDAVENTEYDIGLEFNIHTGLTVSDFVYPRWYELDNTLPSGTKSLLYSFRNSVSNPWEIASGGYISWAPENEPNNWQQTFGDKKEKLPPNASRHLVYS